MDLVIKEELYKIKVGAEVYSIEYPSFEDALTIADQFKEVQEDGKASINLMKKWLVDLGLDEKFFSLKPIKSKHIMQIWQELNTVKK